MKIVIDSNVLFSALIKDSFTRTLILEYDDLFLFPSFIFEEMEKHKDELLKKSKMPEKNFHQLLQLILQKVIIVPNKVLRIHRKEALNLVKDIDPNDVIFVACALTYPNSIIWSDDKKLKRLKKVKVFNTNEIKEYL